MKLRELKHEVVVMSDDVEPKLSQRDWTGIVSITILIGYFMLIGIKYVSGMDITELDGIGTAVGLIIGWYLRGKT